MTTALFLGRFQPLHNGHLWAVKKILKECDSVIIAIGSANKKNSMINPYSADQRKKMIEAALKVEKISQYKIVLVDDIDDDERWVDWVIKHTGKIDVVYTGSPLTKLLFARQGYKIVELPRHDNISSSEVRLRLSKGISIEELIPKEVKKKI